MNKKTVPTFDALLSEESFLKEKLVTLLRHQRAEHPSNFKTEWKHLSNRLDEVLLEQEKLIPRPLK